jgi:hypothetical protein
MDWTTGVRFPAWLRVFSLHSIQTGLGARPASCAVGTCCSVLWVKAVGARCSTLTSIWCRGQEWWAVPLLPHKARCLLTLSSTKITLLTWTVTDSSRHSLETDGKREQISYITNGLKDGSSMTSVMWRQCDVLIRQRHETATDACRNVYTYRASGDSCFQVMG